MKKATRNTTSQRPVIERVARSGELPLDVIFESHPRFRVNKDDLTGAISALKFMAACQTSLVTWARCAHASRLPAGLTRLWARAVEGLRPYSVFLRRVARIEFEEGRPTQVFIDSADFGKSVEKMLPRFSRALNESLGLPGKRTTDGGPRGQRSLTSDDRRLIDRLAQKGFGASRIVEELYEGDRSDGRIPGGSREWKRSRPALIKRIARHKRTRLSR